MNTPANSSAIATLDTNYAEFWKRVVATVIDTLVFLPLIGYVGREPTVYQEMSGTGAILALFFTVLMWLYYAGMESSASQATIGKMLMGIKVTDMNGHRISFARASGRFFGKALSKLIVYIGFIMAAFTEKKQGLHDILAKTLVINK
ncbi:MAG: hypothetical protein H6R05_563 [Burkholderiaceae bacterium]|nr:hypothetical protein [Burkholderiaceae bacterium]